MHARRHGGHPVACRELTWPAAALAHSHSLSRVTDFPQVVVAVMGQRRSAAKRRIGSWMISTTTAVLLLAGCSSNSTDSDASASATTEYGNWVAVTSGDIVTTAPYDGIVSPASSLTVQSSATGTITRLADVAQQVNPGDAVAYLDEQPLIALPGDVPVFRDLALPESGDLRGADVQQLQQFLADQGYFGGTINGRFNASLGKAIRAWRLAQDLSDARTFTTKEIVFIPGSGPWAVTKTNSSLGSAFAGGPLVDVASSGTTVDVKLDAPPPAGSTYSLVPAGGSASDQTSIALQPVGELVPGDDGSYSARLVPVDPSVVLPGPLGSAVVVEQQQVLATDVVTIPVASVRLDSTGGTIAKCRSSPDVETDDCPITVGTSDGQNVEVTSGLTPGQEVAVTP